MENLEGGGHLSNAATQLKHKTVQEAEKLLKEALDDYFEGRREL